MSQSRKSLRLLDQGLLGELDAEQRRSLHRDLRTQDDLRRNYDRAVGALRALERKPVASYEIDLVEQWLEQDGMFGSRPIGEIGRRGSWVAVVVALVAALVLLLRAQVPAQHQDEFIGKGAQSSHPLAIQGLCDSDNSGRRMTEAVRSGCPVSASLAFAVRIDSSFAEPGQLTLFGVDEHGDVRYYIPTPDNDEELVLQRGTWQPLERAVRLAVNHQPGPLRIYALLSPRAATIDEVDNLAKALEHAPPSLPGQPSWHRRWLATPPLQQLCIRPERCASAELSLEIVGAQP